MILEAAKIGIYPTLITKSSALTNVPAELAPIVQSLFGLAVVVLGSFGAYNFLLKDKAKG